MKFSQLPKEIQAAVKAELKTVKSDFVNHQCRYFAIHGYKSAAEYRLHLENSTFKVEAETMVSVLKHVLSKMLKSGKDYLHILPANAARSLREGVMLSKAERSLKVQ